MAKVIITIEDLGDRRVTASFKILVGRNGSDGAKKASLAEMIGREIFEAILPHCIAAAVYTPENDDEFRQASAGGEGGQAMTDHDLFWQFLLTILLGRPCPGDEHFRSMAHRAVHQALGNMITPPREQDREYLKLLVTFPWPSEPGWFQLAAGILYPKAKGKGRKAEF